MWLLAISGSYLADFLRSRGYLSTTMTRKVFNSIGKTAFNKTEHSFHHKPARQGVLIPWKGADYSRHLIESRVLRLFGHIKRSQKVLSKICVEGKIPGKRDRGHPPTRWLDTIKKWTGLTIDKLNIARVNNNNISMAFSMKQKSFLVHIRV